VGDEAWAWADGLLTALETAARELGCHAVRLDTSAHLPEAIGLYRRPATVTSRPTTTT